MSWKDDFNAAVLEFVKTQLNRVDAVEVTGFEQQTTPGFRYSTWTVDPDKTVVEITYKNAGGRSQTVDWEGSMTELIVELTDS